MKYIGNKYRLLSFIESVVTKDGIPAKGTFIDIFAGTTSVAQFFKKKGYRLITNDFMTYSYVFQYAYIRNNKYPKFEKLIETERLEPIPQLFDTKESALNTVLQYLNKLPGEEGFIFRHYSPGGEYGRQYFSTENAKRIDAAREKIQEWKTRNLISEEGYFTLLAVLIDAADFVANISGTYGAYLKIWRSMALKSFTLLMPQLIESDLDHDIYLRDANKLIRELNADILYIDPPYNNRQYAPNFHILETLACWDNPEVHGKTGLRPYELQKSLYSQKTTCKEVFADLIENAHVKYILMSYGTEGIIPHKFVCEILGRRGKVKVHEQIYRRFRTERDHEKRRYKVPDDRTTEIIYSVKVSK